jgi:hypothetical protein
LPGHLCLWWPPCRVVESTNESTHRRLWTGYWIFVGVVATSWPVWRKANCPAECVGTLVSGRCEEIILGADPAVGVQVRGGSCALTTSPSCLT